MSTKENKLPVITLGESMSEDADTENDDEINSRLKKILEDTNEESADSTHSMTYRHSQYSSPIMYSKDNSDTGSKENTSGEYINEDYNSDDEDEIKEYGLNRKLLSYISPSIKNISMKKHIQDMDNKSSMIVPNSKDNIYENVNKFVDMGYIYEKQLVFNNMYQVKLYNKDYELVQTILYKKRK